MPSTCFSWYIKSFMSQTCSLSSKARSIFSLYVYSCTKRTYLSACIESKSSSELTSFSSSFSFSFFFSSSSFSFYFLSFRVLSSDLGLLAEPTSSSCSTMPSSLLRFFLASSRSRSTSLCSASLYLCNACFFLSAFSFSLLASARRAFRAAFSRSDFCLRTISVCSSYMVFWPFFSSKKRPLMGTFSSLHLPRCYVSFWKCFNKLLMKPLA